MAKILIADDEEDIFELIKGFAEREGNICVHAKNGQQAVELCKAQNFDLIIMYVMMDEMDGFTACKEIFKFKKIPVIMLTALGAEYDKLYGFDIGIQDYVTKPFSPRELLARCNVILRRFGKNPDSENSAPNQEEIFGNLKINKTARTVFAGDRQIELSVKEFDILVFLTEHKNQALSRRQIIDSVWGNDYYCDDRTVDWQIKLLRRSLGKDADYIQTLRGVGYKFSDKNK
ncbi:MAG: response regulator transcription factor [Treponema sp.]